MTAARVGIIGIGPRGLTLLERIVANERVGKSGNIHIYIFDPNPPGVGCHDLDQDDLFLVNTVAGQITQFSDATVTGAGPILEGPSFYQWLADERCSRLGSRRGDQPISADAYYSRGLFGRYLHWVYHYLAALAPAHVKITLVRETVVNADRQTDDSWVLSTNKDSFCVNYLFLTTGHTKPARSLPNIKDPERSQARTVVVDDPYPIKKQLAFINSNMTVAIEGMGLTTFDVIAELTVGRGGQFATSPTGQKRYVASGREPRLVTYSRSGLPLTARALNQKGVSVQYRARFLLADKVRSMRAMRKLDFVADIFPLLLADMQYAYYEAYLRDRRDPVAAMLFCNQFLYADLDEREALIKQYVPAPDRFSWERLINPIPQAALVNPAGFNAWMVDYLRQDQIEAKKGNVDGPLKAA
ncbi:MAG: FAD/NAD(P)-binding protein, partial [Cytophagales bacterium]|nr:FAD/NAD(P)-binding protein [Rhizobacter sp.]